MSVNTTLSRAFDNLVGKAGQNCVMQYFYRVWSDAGSIWDDVTSLTEIAGSKIGVSGIILPISALGGTQEYVLREHGLLADGDQKFFVNGSVNFGETSAGSDLQVLIQLGSPTGDKYTIIQPGVQAPEANGKKVYQKVYLRRLTTGSMYGE